VDLDIDRGEVRPGGRRHREVAVAHFRFAQLEIAHEPAQPRLASRGDVRLPLCNAIEEGCQVDAPVAPDLYGDVEAIDPDRGERPCAAHQARELEVDQEFPERDQRLTGRLLQAEVRSLEAQQERVDAYAADRRFAA